MNSRGQMCPGIAEANGNFWHAQQELPLKVLPPEYISGIPHQWTVNFLFGTTPNCVGGKAIGMDASMRWPHAKKSQALFMHRIVTSLISSEFIHCSLQDNHPRSRIKRLGINPRPTSQAKHYAPRIRMSSAEPSSTNSGSNRANNSCSFCSTRDCFSFRSSPPRLNRDIGGSSFAIFAPPR